MKTQVNSKNFSCEFFPPRTPEAQGKLQTTQAKLAELNPGYFSVTFGAGGSTRERTLEAVLSIRKATSIDAAPHISCIGLPLADIDGTLNAYREHGIKRLVALRGDLPSGSVGYGELRFANELVEYIRRTTGDAFHIEVACYPEFHPQAPSAEADLQNFKRKVDAGADGAITQYFFNPDAYFRFVDDCAALGISIPIVAGVMPIVNYTQLYRFSQACGADIPRWILRRLRDFGDDRPAIRAFGIDVATDLCARLLEGGAPGLHFYTLNQAEATSAICKNLNLIEQAA